MRIGGTMAHHFPRELPSFRFKKFLCLNYDHGVVFFCAAWFNAFLYIMLTIISGTNRKDNNTIKVAAEYQRLLHEKGIEADLLSLTDHEVFRRDEAFIALEAKYLQPANKFIIVMPEYNGSYPGILKLMIDNTNPTAAWSGKKVLLTGVSTGRAGNLRGMEHLSGSLLHMKMQVHHNRLPISLVDTLLDESGKFSDETALTAVKMQLEEFLEF